MMGRRSILGRLKRDTRGLGAVEFAMIAPIMILFYFGLAEFCQGYMAQKRTAHVASMVGDLVTQNASLDQAGFNNIFGISTQIMAPFSATPLKQRVTSVTRVSATQLKLDWSKGSGMAPMTPSEASVPDGVINVGQSVIITEATYGYVSPIGNLLPGVTTFTHKTYLLPRNSDTVLCDKAC